MESKVYWGSVEYEGNLSGMNDKPVKGGFVYVFCKSLDVLDFIERLKKVLNSKNVVIKNLEFVDIYEKEMQWETDDETTHYMELYAKAENSDQLILDTFYEYAE